ncbi:hypothetical protein PHMEG_00012422 [Phytophthora megakarya]|uniref:ATP-dependent DNA helicase n=1 Tax=Phytophthora megakarya TaxID=4795 RepID=A0A225W977_9STRA|nr:hypothetical protein PHMEG_00012422 [Phytophthora megakarya]
MLIIDEISMMTKLDWLKLDKLLRQRKRISGVPFRGVHIVLVGHFLQLPPVGSDPICIDPRNKLKYSTDNIEGFLLWRRFESVIVLEESVRFRDDPEWGAGCAQARVGNWTPPFIKLINSRLVRERADRNWSTNTVFVTPDNLTRTAINSEFIKEAAKQLPLGKYPIRLVVQFSSSLSGLSRREVEYVMGLPDSRFGRMAPFIDLVEGMPVQVTENVRPAKGAANSTLGTLERVVFSPGTRFKLVRDCNANMIVQVPTKPPCTLCYALIEALMCLHLTPQWIMRFFLCFRKRRCHVGNPRLYPSCHSQQFVSSAKS